MIKVVSLGQEEVKCYGNGNFEFGIEKEWELNVEVPIYQLPKIMDINSDDIQEIIVAGKIEGNPGNLFYKDIKIVNSVTHEVVNEISTYYFFDFMNNFIVLRDEFGGYEIIVAVADIDLNPTNVRRKLVCYRSDGNIKWVSDYKYGVREGKILNIQGNNLSLADFNQDGIPEVYTHNEIFNARTGKKLVDGGNNGFGSVRGLSVAANLDDDPNDLELAAGNTIYKVRINRTNGLAGNEMIPYFMRGMRDGYTTIADINGDGRLDVIVASLGNSEKQTSSLYIYTLEKDECTLIAKKEWNQIIAHFGQPAIGKFTNNRELDIVLFVNDSISKFSLNSNNELYKDWSFLIDDYGSSAAITGFDFDNDGVLEIAFKDLNGLKVIKAKENMPVMIGNVHCKSATLNDFPIVADIYNEGTSRICVTCWDNDPYAKLGYLTIFGPPEGKHWAPARNIWHQYGYNPLFINDDGTVPQHMHNPATYKNGKYNNFNVQENLLDGDGKIPAASLYGDIPCIGYDVDTDSYHVSFTVRNRADASATAKTNVPVAF
ncbi:MAG: VCBS repeat-containing protein, partial [Chitinophagales bacterium]|nr:VCBS repeat-containing protein [Chitinophagales bacterium]